MNWRGEWVINDKGSIMWGAWFHIDSPELRDAVCFGMLEAVIRAAERGVKVGQA